MGAAARVRSRTGRGSARVSSVVVRESTAPHLYGAFDVAAAHRRNMSAVGECVEDVLLLMGLEVHRLSDFVSRIQSELHSRNKHGFTQRDPKVAWHHHSRAARIPPPSRRHADADADARGPTTVH